MRLQFQLKQVKIDPTCHVQLARHAEEYLNKNVTGFLYGALMDDQASVTSILPFPNYDPDAPLAKEDITAMEKRQEQKLNFFNLDHENIGFYLICHQGNFWDEIQNVKLNESYNNTSFFLVYDYEAKIEGRNPYRAYRMNDSFATAQKFNWADLQKLNIKQNNPFIQIPTFVQKNQMFEALMMFHRQDFISGFSKRRKSQKEKNLIRNRIQSYLEAIEEHQSVSKKVKDTEKRARKSDGKSIEQLPVNQFYSYIASDLKLQAKEAQFTQHRKNLQILGSALQ